MRAQKWFNDLFIALESIREFPERHAVISESDQLKKNLRSFHHHSHRVIYEVQAKVNVVYIVRVYHGARKPLTQMDIR